LTGELKVRPAGDADIVGITRMLAAAFQDEPAMSFIFPDPDTRRARLPGFFKVIYQSDYPAGACYVTANGEAATIWQAPGHGYLSWLEKIRLAWPWIAASRMALGRALTYSAASDANRPKEPHWYLHIAGCAPSEQGRGFGGAVIRAGLARCDLDGVAAYLETSTESNLVIYESLGFVTTHEWTVKNGPRCWSMFRSKRS
jgi:GNAT superfamily N-acetyltransferase